MLSQLALTLLPSVLVPCASPPTASVQEVHCSEQVLAAPAGDPFTTYVDGSPPQIAWPLAVGVAGEPGDRRLHTYEALPAGQGWAWRQALSGDDPDTRFGEDYHLGREADGSLTLVVGEPDWRNAGGVPRGCVRVYRWSTDSSTWQLAQQIFPTTTGSARFGSALDRDGDWLAVQNESADKSVHMYRRNPTTGAWSHQQALAAPADGFGGVLELGGHRLLVRLSQQPEQWLFERQVDGSWSFVEVFPQSLYDPWIRADEVLGTRPVSLGTTPFDTHEVVVLRLDPLSGDWLEHQVLNGADFAPFVQQVGDGFLRFAASDDLLLATGNYATDPATPEQAGRAYAYVRDGSGDWIPLQVLDRGAAAVVDERFGYHVAVDGFRGLVQSRPQFLPNDRIVQVDLDPTDCDGDLVPDACQLLQPGQDLDGDGEVDACGSVGSAFCTPAVPNSTGLPGRLVALGSAVLSEASLSLCADQLPAHEFGYLLASSGPGNTLPGNSAGVLCLATGPDLGRYTDQVLSSGPLGQACTSITLPQVPTAGGVHLLAPGETWCFQFWHRDGTSSNFTSAVEVLFQ